MPNFLYPEAVSAWARRELAGQPLPALITDALQVQLTRWASQQEENTRVITNLPQGAPEWAVIRHAQGDPVHHFVPSDATRQVMKQLVSFLTETVVVNAESEHQQLCLLARRVLRSLDGGRFSVPTLLQQRREWLAQPARIQELQALGRLEAGDLPRTPLGQWRECETLQQVHWVGEALGNCLADGFYDDHFNERDNSGLRLFYLQDDVNGTVLAAASFYFGELDDFEAVGADRPARQQQARAYRSDLIDLLDDLDYAVSPLNRKSDARIGNRIELIERTGICGRFDLEELEYAEFDGFRFWYDRRAKALILRAVQREQVVQVDIDENADSGFFAAGDDTDATSPTGHFGLVSLRRQIDPALFDSACFDSLCQALSQAVKQGNFEGLDLPLFHEFAEDGTYWHAHLGGVIRTTIGHLLKHNERVWWVPNPSRRLAYVWYDVGHQDSPIDTQILERMLQRVVERYERPGSFWAALANLGVPYPDLRRTASGAPLIEPTIHNNQWLAAEVGWMDRGQSADFRYQVCSRPVDDHWPLQQDSEQWVCWHRDRGPVAGLLVRHRGPRRREFYIQAPGQDPRGLAELKRIIRAAGLINAWSRFIIDHDLVVFDKPIDDWLLRRGGQPIAPTSAIAGTTFSLGGTHRRLFVFDEHERLVLIVRSGRDNRLLDAAIVGDPEALRTCFPALIGRLGVQLTDKLEPVARLFGYRVTDGALDVIPPAPAMDEPGVTFALSAEGVEILYEPEDIFRYDDDVYDDNVDDIDAAFIERNAPCVLPTVTIRIRRTGALTLSGSIQPDRKDGEYRVLQEAVLRAVNYLGATLSTEIERVFGLRRQACGQYIVLESEPPPSGWSFIGDGEQARWMLDNAIAAPAIWYCDGTIGCAADDCERMLDACDSIRGFLAWRES